MQRRRHQLAWSLVIFVLLACLLTLPLACPSFFHHRFPLHTLFLYSFGIMATRGVTQLQKITLKYCEYGGSSRALREYLANGQLVAWAKHHADTAIEVKVRNGHHPVIQADYLTGHVQHQVSVKNYERWQDVQDVCQMLANRSGRKITKITQPVLTDTPSVQGVWTPFLNLQLEPDFEIKFVEQEE